jgi:PKD repeat protein
MDIILSRPVANFTMSTDSLNLFETDTVYFRDNSKFAKRWLWNFDNGNNGFVPNTFSRYATKKQYRVSLVVFDSLNCMDTLRKKLVVYDEAVLTSLDPNDDYGFDVFPNPTTDLIHIAFSKYGHLPISYQLVSANGAQVFSAAPHTLEKSFESISLKNFAKGFYILHIRIGDKLFNKKVVLN